MNKSLKLNLETVKQVGEVLVDKASLPTALETAMAEKVAAQAEAVFY